MKIKHIYLGSLTSLAIMATAFAHAQEMVTAPTFDGGITASVGTFYAVPAADNNEYFFVTDKTGEGSPTTLSNAQPDYNFGIEASLGYIFEDTANGIELAYRGINADGTSYAQNGNIPDEGSWDNVQDDIKYELNALDLMISQYMDLGTHMQMRFSGGLSYVELEETQNVYGSVEGIVRPGETISFAGKEKSRFTGWGPRLAMDARYDFGEDLAGFGIVGGASVAYYLGETNTSANLNAVTAGTAFPEGDSATVTDDVNNHSVTNLRGNLGIDYVYFFDNEEESTLGLELGYLVDFYNDAIATATTGLGGSFEDDATGKVIRNESTGNSPVTFSGPYLLLKGAF
jgi:hypothetical protein